MTTKKPNDTVPVTTTPKTTLADIRADAMASTAEAAHQTAKTIADLEAWRTEIDATIAFLKAQRR